ncbi:MAG: hypothetical protein KatS3mg122_1999 [Caldimonas sp.]|nr:MAG: hypothetical protein KatS3mg122_1999 [Caldimonas sp.]
MPRLLAPQASPDDTEAQFYEALQQGDIDKLMAVWADDEEVVCIPPGGPRLVGLGAIRAQFAALFAHGSIQAQPERVRRMHAHDSAVHSVIEQVRVMTEDGPRSVLVVATNVYVKTALGWRMVCHHASPGSPHEPTEAGEAPTTLH